MVLYDQAGESRRLIPLALGLAMATGAMKDLLDLIRNSQDLWQSIGIIEFHGDPLVCKIAPVQEQHCIEANMDIHRHLPPRTGAVEILKAEDQCFDPITFNDCRRQQFPILLLEDRPLLQPFKNRIYRVIG
jgi:hypothetical protein